jgi:hypothetical protein
MKLKISKTSIKRSMKKIKNQKKNNQINIYVY